MNPCTIMWRFIIIEEKEAICTFFFSFAVLISTVSHQQQQSNVKPCDSSNIQKIFITYISHTHIAWLSEINENKSLNWRGGEKEKERERCCIKVEKMAPLHITHFFAAQNHLLFNIYANNIYNSHWSTLDWHLDQFTIDLNCIAFLLILFGT